MCKDVYRGAEMETKHTPGPWFQSHRKTAPDSYNTQVYTQNGEAICTLAWYPKPEVNGVVGTYREANARLIAAAPELLAALKACHLQMLQSNNDSEYAIEANEMAKAAIAKAESL
jgi:hypothetical protein